MPDPIIIIEGLSKQYKLRPASLAYGSLSLRDVITSRLRSLIQRDSEPSAPMEDFWALQDVSFSVKPGETVGIIGRNGAGKSTLLKLLSRITDPTCGQIELNGRVASLLEVGTGFHQELSGRENIYLNGAILGMSRTEIKARFDEIVEFAEVGRFLDTPVKRYSSGMYVRLAFAVAAHLHPEILIVDEVLAVGDAQFQKKCLARMREVSHGGRTVLFVSHNMEAISSLCTRAIFLENGRIKVDTDVASAIRQYSESAVSSQTEWQGRIGDDQAFLTSAWIRSTEGDPHLHTATPLEIGIRFTLTEKTRSLILGYTLFSEYGHELIYSLHDDTSAQPVDIWESGSYERRFVIPANKLSAGSYWIEFDLGIHMVKKIVPEGSLRMEFNLDNIAGIGRHYIAPHMKGRRSVLRPDW